MKNVLITGASKGIGYSIAKKLASEKKYNIVINYNKSKKEAFELLEKIKSYGSNVIAIKCDVSNSHEVKSMFKEIKKIFGDVDILINNAAISITGLFQDTSEFDFKNIFNTNVFGTYNTISQAINPMISKKDGVILNISSIWGSRGASCEVLYSATKGAIESLTKSLALELAPSNIRVNAIAPGCVNTNMLSSYSKENLSLICNEIPMMRIADSNEIAELVSFIISEKNSYMTGQIINVDGGMSV